MDSFFEKALIEHWSAERTARSLHESGRVLREERSDYKTSSPTWDRLSEATKEVRIEAARLDLQRLAREFGLALDSHGFVLMTREQQRHYREMLRGQEPFLSEGRIDFIGRMSSQKDTQNPKKGLRPIHRGKLNELEDRFGAYLIGAVVTAYILSVRFLYQSTGLAIGVAIFAGFAVAWMFKAGVENKTKWRERAEYLEEKERSSQ